MMMISQHQHEPVGLAAQPSPNEIAVVDEHGNTVGMLISNPAKYSQRGPDIGLHLRYPISCSKQANITTNWLTQNFEENAMTSVPRSVMFEEYCNYCRGHSIKPFNQAVFGKVVRACFPNLTTRRLGVRGQSRYHYAGLGVKLTSRYSSKFRGSGERLNVLRTNNPSNRRRVSGVQVALDGKQDVESGVLSMQAEIPDAGSSVAASAPSFLPPYPSEDDVVVPARYTKYQMAQLLAYYQNYCRNLLGYMINLDFDQAANHFRAFYDNIPQQCRDMLQSSYMCDVIMLCDDIMYQEATAALLPNCLATLTTEFNVLVRKFAKSIPIWIKEGFHNDLSRGEILRARLEAAKTWSDYVRRVTTLCHVAKEARKTLKDPITVSQLLSDLRHIGITDIVDQCFFASYEEKDKFKFSLAKERQDAAHHVSYLCKLLQRQAPVETYAAHIERVVNKYASLRPERKMGDDPRPHGNCSIITQRTRRFVMKWTTYASKMLTEVTLKSSESVGTFHLILLLFGDYVNHVICLRDERAKRIELMNKVVRKGSSYFERMRDPTAEHENEQALNLSQRSSSEAQPLQANYPTSTGHASGTIFTTPVALPNVKHELQPQGARPFIRCNCGPQCSGMCAYNMDGKVTYADGAANNLRAVVVQPAFNCGGDSFYLLPSSGNEPGGAMLLKK